MSFAMVYIDHGEALEADFFRFYGLDINTCSVRRMMNLFSRLPYNSEVHYDMAEVPRESRVWDINTYMLANVVDMLGVVDWRLVAVNSKRPPRKPKPIERPKLKKPKKKAWLGKTIVDKGKVNES